MINGSDDMRGKVIKMARNSSVVDFRISEAPISKEEMTISGLSEFDIKAKKVLFSLKRALSFEGLSVEIVAGNWDGCVSLSIKDNKTGDYVDYQLGFDLTESVIDELIEKGNIDE